MYSSIDAIHPRHLIKRQHQPNSLTNIKSDKGYMVLYNSPSFMIAQNPIYLPLRHPINNDRLHYYMTITPFAVLTK